MDGRLRTRGGLDSGKGNNETQKRDSLIMLVSFKLRRQYT